MSHARDLLSLLLASSTRVDAELSLTNLTGRSAVPLATKPNLPETPLSCSIVTKPTAIPSVVSFNSQLALGSKDSSLRKAAQLLRRAADSTDRVGKANRSYWSRGYEIRDVCWGLAAAPLPYIGLQHHQGRGADKVAKDFLVTFGLEGGSLF